VAAELVVGPAGHLQQRPRPVGRRQLQRLGVAALDHLLERGLERSRRQPVGLRLVDDPEARVDPSRGGMGGEQPPTEAVDGRDPGPLARLRRLDQRLPHLALGRERPAVELLPHPPPQLVGRPLGEGEGEDPLDPRLGVERRGAEAVDQHGRLAGAGAGSQEDVAVALRYGLELLGGALAHSSSSSCTGSSSGTPRSRRQIGWK
jgi:hypothetical protein